MRLPISVPLLVRNVKVAGPEGFVSVDLIVDTGAVFTALSWSLLKVIGYDPSSVPGRHEIITANGTIEVPKLRVESITVGNAQAKDVEIIAHDIPELTRVRGLLGLSFLQKFKTIIDYKKGYIEIT